MRFIPARAGNAARRSTGRARSTVHPRACGERYGARGVAITGDGSSPRVRGTPVAREHHRFAGRFIPARAGNARPTTGCVHMRTVHPRACGERAAFPSGGTRHNGSSPRVRGTRHRERRRRAARRFIPARAGNAARSEAPAARKAVHPRACGERADCTSDPFAVNGSSPRVRGTQGRGERQQRVERFIPARAGNAPTSFLRRRRSPVHPRACGERPGFMRPEGIVVGSSPRVRGTRRAPRARAPACRFIPARAGNAVLALATDDVAPVHPRACGERGPARTARRGTSGSSPRVRGTRVVRADQA